MRRSHGRNTILKKRVKAARPSFGQLQRRRRSNFEFICLTVWWIDLYILFLRHGTLFFPLFQAETVCLEYYIYLYSNTPTFPLVHRKEKFHHGAKYIIRRLDDASAGRWSEHFRLLAFTSEAWILPSLPVCLLPACWPFCCQPASATNKAQTLKRRRQLRKNDVPEKNGLKNRIVSVLGLVVHPQLSLTQQQLAHGGLTPRQLCT